MRSIGFLGWVVAVVVGCGGPHGSDEDGGSDASVPDGGTPTVVHVAAQNTWLLSPPSCGATNDVISISGHWFLQQGALGSDFAGFLGRTQQDVEDRLRVYLGAHPEVPTETTAILILDIEDPHPNALHTFSASDQDAIVSAYKVRIAATKAVFPNARLGLYGTLNADQRGRTDDPTYLARLAALIEAGGEGLYDQLDYLVPVLYVRFGCDEVNGTCDSGWGTGEAYTQQGIEGSMQLKRSDGTSLPLLPLFGFRIFNASSLFDDVLLLDLNLTDPIAATLGAQFDVLEAHGVADAVFWSGRPEELLAEPNPNGRTITDYVCSSSLRN